MRHQVTRVNVDDELELRELFFGEGDGKNYAVLCHPEDANYPISSVFNEASMDGSAPAEFRLLDCNHVLSSEKNVFDRFNLKDKPRPTIFVSGKVGPPKQVRHILSDMSCIGDNLIEVFGCCRSQRSI